MTVYNPNRPGASRWVKQNTSPPPKSDNLKEEDFAAIFTRSSLNWPRHWRITIGKVERTWDVNNHRAIYRVRPLNPEWNDPPNDGIFDPNWEPPPMYLDWVEFSSFTEIDTWARVCARLEKS